MYDMLPFPHITATKAEEQVAQINNYLIQFKETLEFILTNISADNLSPDLVNKLNSLGAEIEKTQSTREEEIQQVTNKMITVSDVINSPAFQTDMDIRQETIKDNLESQIEADMDVMQTELEQRVDSKIPTASEVLQSFEINVNYNTGHLEY